MSFRYCIVLFFAASLLAGTPPETHRKHAAQKTQTQPTPQRIAEIQSALKAHGYDPGTTWEETQEIAAKLRTSTGGKPTMRQMLAC